MQCYVCHATRPRAGGLWPTTHEAVAICQHCGGGVCNTHARRAELRGSPIYCEDCLAVVTAEAAKKDEANKAAASLTPSRGSGALAGVA